METGTLSNFTMDRSELSEKLLIWMQTFDVNHDVLTIDRICDGIFMSNVLHQIAPEFFSTYWLSKINSLDSSSNWRLKVSNLKRVLNGIVDYHADVLGLRIPESNIPDVRLIAESSNREELSRMLQLILSCAVNCKDKSDHIRRIMDLEESVQAMVMTAIQELMLKETSVSSDPNVELTEQVRKLTDQVNVLLQEKDELCQRCHEFDLQVASMIEENTDLHSQNKRLLDSVEKSENLDDPTTVAGRRIQQQHSKILSLQDEVFQLETAKEDLRMKFEVKSKEHSDAAKRITELTRVAEQTSHLKDELDILRHTSEQVERYETTIDSYRKRLDQMSGISDQLKLSEEKISILLLEKSSLQEEVKKSVSYKEQLYNAKKSVLELESKLDEQTKVSEKTLSDGKVNLQLIDTLTKEKERLRLECDSLRVLNEELQCTRLNQQNIDMTGEHMFELSQSPPSMDLLSVPLPIRQKIIQLEHQVKTLQPEADKHVELEAEKDQLKVELESSTSRQSLLQHDIETLHKRIVEVEMEKSDAERQIEDLTETNRKLSDKTKQQQQDMALMEDKYRGYLEKAKLFIRSIDPKNHPSSSSAVASLTAQLAEKDKLIKHLENQLQTVTNHKEQERKLMVSAWYNMSSQLNRRSIEERLSNNNSGQSFLARQRQAHIRRKLPSAPTPILQSTPISKNNITPSL